MKSLVADTQAWLQTKDRGGAANAMLRKRFGKFMLTLKINKNMLRILLCTIILVLLACGKSNNEIYNKLKKVSEELNIDNLSIEYQFSSESKKKLLIIIEEASNIDKYYKENNHYFFGKIAYEMYKCLDSAGVDNEYSEIIVSNKNFQTKFPIDRLIQTKKMLSLTNNFIRKASEVNLDEVKAIIDESYINDSALISICEGVVHMNKCGNILNEKFLGIYYDKTEKTGDNVTIIEKKLWREKSQDIFTFYVLDKNERIIYLNMISSNNCE
ncbi:MAG: hypothetical protein K0B10_14970 [Vicingaceae bacterium]|nr:hypothetical protein [Vicingaceae bacterium]